MTSSTCSVEFPQIFGLPVDAIPPEEQQAVMYAYVEAVKGALADLEKGTGVVN